MYKIVYKCIYTVLGIVTLLLNRFKKQQQCNTYIRAMSECQPTFTRRLCVQTVPCAQWPRDEQTITLRHFFACCLLNLTMTHRGCGILSAVLWPARPRQFHNVSLVQFGCCVLRSEIRFGLRMCRRCCCSSVVILMVTSTLARPWHECRQKTCQLAFKLVCLLSFDKFWLRHLVLFWLLLFLSASCYQCFNEFCLSLLPSLKLPLLPALSVSIAFFVLFCCCYFPPCQLVTSFSFFSLSVNLPGYKCLCQLAWI